MTDRNEDAELDAMLAEELAKTEGDEESTVQTDEAEAEQSEAVETEAEGEQPETVEIPEELQPVSAWNEDARQAWESFAANQEYHDSLRHLASQFNSDYKYRTQLEQERAELQPLAQTAQQFQQMAQQYGDVFQGRNPMDVVGEYLYYGQQLARNPAETIQALAKNAGIDLNQLVQDQPYVDEYTQRLQSEVEQVRNEIRNQQNAQQQAQFEGFRNNAMAFESETDAEGNLLRPYLHSQNTPHANRVAQEMMGMLTSGQANSLQDAYDRACWSNPEIRSELMKAEGQSKKQQHQAQAQKAKAAAKAQPRPGKSAKGQPKGVEDLDDALEKGYAEISAA